MVQLRKSNPVLVYGAYKLLVPNDTKVYAYTRTLGNEQLLILLNFSADKADFALTKKLNPASVLINNYRNIETVDKKVRLAPYQVVVVRLK